MATLSLAHLIASAAHGAGFGKAAENGMTSGSFGTCAGARHRFRRLVMMSLLTTASSFCGPAFAAESKVAAVDDFHRLCLATRADHAKAFDLADKMGWKATPSSMAENNLAMAGSPDGRVINNGTPQYRVMLAGMSKADSRIKTCVIVSRASFQAVTAAFNQEFGPAQQTPIMWGWTIAETGGRRKIVKKDSDLSPHPERLYQVFAYDMDKDGSIIRLDELPF